MSDDTNWVYEVEIRYKSGHMITEWFSKFEVVRENVGYTYVWREADPRTKLAMLGPDDIESVMIVDTITKEEFDNLEN